jgi:hypothetical protein
MRLKWPLVIITIVIVYAVFVVAKHVHQSLDTLETFADNYMFLKSGRPGGNAGGYGVASFKHIHTQSPTEGSSVTPPSSQAPGSQLPIVRQTCAALKTNPANTCDAGKFPNMHVSNIEIDPSEYKRHCCSDNPVGTCTELQAANPRLVCGNGKKPVATASSKQSLMSQFEATCCETQQTCDALKANPANTCDAGKFPNAMFPNVGLRAPHTNKEVEPNQYKQECCTDNPWGRCADLQAADQTLACNTNQVLMADVVNYKSDFNRACCRPKVCPDTYPVNCPTGYSKKPGFDTLAGSTMAECCTQDKTCLEWYMEKRTKFEPVCSGSQLVDDAMTKIGSSEAVCCK